MNKLHSSRLPFIFVVLVLLTDGPSVSGQEEGITVRTSLTPEGTAVVGQRVVYSIDVLAKDRWASLPRLPDVEVKNAIVYTPPGQSQRLTEGASTGQRYEWWVFPQSTGELRIPEVSILVEAKAFGLNAEVESKRATSEAISIEVNLPPGVTAGTSFVNANQFVAKQSWDPKAGPLRVGDGITRTIEQTIDGAPAMLMPPIEFAELSGAKLYRKQPSLEDSFNRGSLSGKRRDSVTYVFEAAGQYEIPSVSIVWWDNATSKLQTITLDALEVSVDPDQSAVSESESEPLETSSAGRLGKAILLALGSVFVGVVVYRRLEARRNARHQSEQAFYRRFVDKCRANDPAGALRFLTQWWDHANAQLDAPRLDLFLNSHGDKAAKNQLNLLYEAVDGNGQYDPQKLIAAISAARDHWLAASRMAETEKRSILPPLYPFKAVKLR